MPSDFSQRSTSIQQSQPNIAIEEGNVTGADPAKDSMPQWGKRAIPTLSNESSLKPIQSETRMDSTRSSDSSSNIRRAGTVSGVSSRHVSRSDMPSEAGAPPLPIRKPNAFTNDTTRKASQTNGAAQTLQSKDMDTGQLFKEFFGEAGNTHVGEFEGNTQSIVNAKPDADVKIKTLRKDISELSVDGRTTSLSSQQDHVLFNKCMYICTHIFGDLTGARNTEVYLWAGSAIVDGCLEEAQVFARKAAKDCNGKLVLLRQGKESPNFLQALGGILITRNGTSKDHKRSYMLCGRRHLGHVAFDEVDLSPANLCSGFPFIVASAATNTIFLWKGKGCDSEELAGARLMSMDLGLSGRVVEVDEGQETTDFWSAFPSAHAKDIPQSADYWKLKPQYHGYHVRLFRVEFAQQQDSAVTAIWNRVRQPGASETSPKSSTHVQEVIPFCEVDVEPENIYVLDGFFEIFV